MTRFLASIKDIDEATIASTVDIDILDLKNINDGSVKSTNILRYYGIGAQIIKDFKIKNMILVSRSRKKIIGLEGYGIKITKQEIIK